MEGYRFGASGRCLRALGAFFGLLPWVVHSVGLRENWIGLEWGSEAVV